MRDKKGEIYDWLSQKDFILISQAIYQSVSSDKWANIPVNERYDGVEWVSDGHFISWICMDSYKHLSDEKKKSMDGKVEDYSAYIPKNFTGPVTKLDAFELNFFRLAAEDDLLHHIYVPTSMIDDLKMELKTILGETNSLPN